MESGTTTVRDALLAFAVDHPTQGAEELAKVTPLPLPSGTARAALAFETLSATRRSGLTPSPICLPDIEAWERRFGPLSMREVGWVGTMDRAFRAAVTARE